MYVPNTFKLSFINGIYKNFRFSSKRWVASPISKTVFISGINFDKIAKEEILNTSNNINELSDIGDSNHTISFYLTFT